MTNNKINCKKCDKEKHISEFYKSKINKSICKECWNKISKINLDRKYIDLKNEIIGYYVYRLILNNEIIYIGKSECLSVRLKAHKKDKKFDKVEIIRFNNRPNMHLAEVYFINKFKPVLNKEYLYKYDKIMTMPLFDNLEWKTLNNIESHETINKNLCDIKTCFIRKRSRKYIVYTEYSNGKQKNMGSFEYEEQAKQLRDYIRQHIQQSNKL